MVNFSFSLLKKQKIVSAEKQENEKEMVSEEEERWCQRRRMVGRPGMFRWALQCRFHQFEKIPNLMVCQALSCLTLDATNFFI